MNMKTTHKIAGLLTVTLLMGFVGCEKSTKPKHFANENWAQADVVQGAQLYDKWWNVTGGTEPTSNFDPIWSTQTTNTRTGSTTWRCKECHGWDYIGNDGRYSSGSHYTGFEGVWTARTNERTQLFDAIRNEGGDHDFSEVLSDQNILDLTKFIVDGLVDMSLYIDSQGAATGSPTNGQALYVTNCVSCHGTDGLTMDFDSDPGIQGVGWLSNDNPQETLHKIRWGHPGSNPAMPSMVAVGLTNQAIGDILAYAQTLSH